MYSTLRQRCQYGVLKGRRKHPFHSQGGALLRDIKIRVRAIVRLDREMGVDPEESIQKTKYLKGKYLTSVSF